MLIIWLKFCFVLLQLVSLCANDGQRLYDAVQYGPFVFSVIPVIGATVYAGYLLGPWGIFGFVIFFAFIFFQVSGFKFILCVLSNSKHSFLLHKSKKITKWLTFLFDMSLFIVTCYLCNIWHSVSYKLLPLHLLHVLHITVYKHPKPNCRVSHKSNTFLY